MSITYTKYQTKSVMLLCQVGKLPNCSTPVLSKPNRPSKTLTTLCFLGKAIDSQVIEILNTFTYCFEAVKLLVFTLASADTYLLTSLFGSTLCSRYCRLFVYCLIIKV